MIFRAILFLLLFFSAGSSFGKVQKIGIPEIEYFNRRQYGGSTQNWDATQSDAGFMYFANNQGVLEYDGKNWKILEELNQNVIRSINVIRNRIYVGLFDELGYFEYDSLQQLKYTSLRSKIELVGISDIWDVHSWNDIVVFRSEQNLFFFKDDKLLNIIAAPSRFASSFLVNGLLLVHDEQAGLMEIRGDKAFPVAGGHVFVHSEIAAVLPLSDGKIIIGTMKEGLYLWDMQRVVKWDVEADHLLKQTNIFCGKKYRDEFFVFGTIQGGMVITDIAGNVFMQIDKDKGLNNNTVLSLEIDREGNIWGGLDNGIVRVNFNSSVTFLQGYYNLGTGYCLDKYEGDFYFGTNQALFKISEAKFLDPLKTRKDFKKVMGSEGQVWALYQDENSLLCGHNHGAFDIQDKGAIKLTPENVNGVWNFKPVVGRPDLLISGTYKGLCLFEKRGARWYFKNKIKGFNQSSRYIEWDDKGNLWMSHGLKGVYKFRFNEDLSQVLEVDTFKNEELPGNSSNWVLSKIQGKCVFSGTDGVYKLSNDDRFFERDVRYDSFFQEGRFPHSLKEDKYNNIWYFHDTSVGVLRYMEDGTYKKVHNPFLSLERKLVGSFEFIAVQDQENALFGVEDGFAHYSAKDVKNYQIPFYVHVRSFKAYSDSTSYCFNSGPSGQTPQSYVPQFRFRNNSFEVSYVASFLEGSGVRYSTFLDGLDQGYSEWSEGNNRSFGNLREGVYRFWVKAINKYGVEAEPIRFRFEVLPPWHRTIYAKIGSGVLLVALIFSLLFFINRRVDLSRQKERARQQERFKVREEQLKHEALQSEKEMIKMRNDRLRGEMVFKEKELANSTVHLIQKNELLSDIKAQLKKLHKVQGLREAETKINAIVKKIDKEITDENSWEVFEMHFGQVHEEFLKRLMQQHPALTLREQKLCAFIKMGMSSKEIASLMNITTRAVENNRYKLRQKLGIDHGENLSAYIVRL